MYAHQVPINQLAAPTAQPAAAAAVPPPAAGAGRMAVMADATGRQTEKRSR